MTLLLVAKLTFHPQVPRRLDRLRVLGASVIPGIAAFQVARLPQREPRAAVELEAV